MAVTHIENIGRLRDHVGQQVALSDWLEVSQERINQFAEATDDRQWIHVDAERARRELPLKETIAHGFLTLSAERTGQAGDVCWQREDGHLTTG